VKKFLIAAATLAMLSTASFADQNTENQNKMDEMRHQFMVMTDQMINGQMEMLKMHEAMLSNYQKLLKQMMENESSSH
jgi:opacity protein-like surface antigen